MSRNKLKHGVISSASIRTVLAIGLTVFSVSIVNANAAQGSAAASTATFRTKCVMCHGPDGAGSEVGKSMNVPDLRSQDVQHLADAELVQIVSDGKSGMPSFKSSLSADQIQALVKYVRTLGKKK